MAPLQTLTKLLSLYLLSLLFIGSTLVSSSHQPVRRDGLLTRRRILELEGIGEDDEPIVIKKKKPSSNPTISANTKSLTKPSSFKNNQTKLTKPSNTTAKSSSSSPPSLFKNTTKPNKSPPFDPIKTTNKTKVIITKKTNSTSIKSSTTLIKKLNSSKVATLSTTKNSSDLHKPLSPKDKTTKSQIEKHPIKDKARPGKAKKLPSWIESDEEDNEDDLVSEFRDLPSKFQETIIPDLERISKTSQIYLTKYNKEFTKGFKPYVGPKYASTVASLVSFASIIVPLIFVSLIFNKIKAYFSIQKLLIFIQIYLAIYFTILGLSSLVTGLEPLKFFYSASQSTYVCVQVLQTLAYVLYLLLLLMYLVLVFSTDTELPTKLLALGQTLVGFAVGLHYYITVFHRAVLRQPPKSSWKVHVLYATCFVVICLLGRMDRRKKAYLQGGGEEGKKS